MNGAPGFHDLREEVLERVYVRGADGAPVSELCALGDETELRATIYRLEQDGLLTADNGRVHTTPTGDELARHVVRAHRLAARLLADLLEIPLSSIDQLACRLEHAISPALADSLCTLLGHPPTAPNGEPIPPGECCRTARHEVGSVVRPLHELALGERGRITFVHPRFHQRLEQLSALGIVPGTVLRLKQRQPAIVIEVDETTLALDAEVARDIFVKPVS